MRDLSWFQEMFDQYNIIPDHSFYSNIFVVIFLLHNNNNLTMNQTSKTGLSSSPTKIVPKYVKTQNVQLKAIARPAPFVLKPYSGLYNPYSNGCSLLCNHPMDKQTKELFRKAKENWANDERRNNLLAEEIDVIKTTLSQFSCGDRHLFSQVECVPEELFRRYTDTDSRPLTPAPTLASAATRASGSRRCLTPEARPAHPKARLVLDLRRTHSQDTISYSASFQGGLNQNVITRTASLEELPRNRQSVTSDLTQSPRKAKTATDRAKINFANLENRDESKLEENKRTDSKNEEDEYIKRRGKKKKKKPREPPFQPPTDPETQVATIGSGSSVNQSARASLIPVDHDEEHSAREKLPSSRKLKSRPHKSVDVDSYLSAEILKQLRRELNEDMVDSELNLKRKAALKEALKTIPKDKTDCEELLKLQHELAIPKLNADFWILLPRMFTRSSARFELPMNSSSLSRMTPLDYVRDHVSISSERKLLFNCIFNKFKMDNPRGSGDKHISGQAIQEALDVLMGRPMNTEETLRFRSLVGWREEETFDFRTFCGIAALCERIMAPSYCNRLPDRKADPCHEIETADFELLARKIQNQDVDKRLLQILRDIKYF